MKILIDENLPKKLKQDLSLHNVFTVRDKGVAIKNKWRFNSFDVGR